MGIRPATDDEPAAGSESAATQRKRAPGDKPATGRKPSEGGAPGTGKGAGAGTGTGKATGTGARAPRRPAAPAAARRGPGPGRLVARVLATLMAFAALVLFAALLSRVTLEPSAAAERLTHTNLRPGDSLREYLDRPALRQAAQQLGGNIVLGVPFGVLLPVMAPQTRGFFRVTLCAALVMLLVETVQGVWVTGRAFDIDDVILNATGAALGYLLLGRRLGRVHRPKPRPRT
ncbi:VanZ family protein [Streptomyces axinellae]|uniref:VanZ-like domain-containing protein n=1 Tax=Streptomyces axinellae TaxID=552788 RepID=A0ABN3QGW7_9ACTN